MSDFYPLYKTNNWEHIETFIGKVEDGRRMTEETHKSVVVRFPDDTVDVLDLEWKVVTTPYGDMGHTYEATSNIPFAKIDVHGCPVSVRLDSLRGIVVRP